jgi:hypothetical protein
LEIVNGPLDKGSNPRRFVEKLSRRDLADFNFRFRPHAYPQLACFAIFW